MKKKLEDIYLNLVYEWNQKSIDEQNRKIWEAIVKRGTSSSPELYDYESKHLDLIWEATYFDDVDSVFEDWFTEQFLKFREECKKKAEAGEEYEKELHLPVAEIAKHLPLDKIKDFKNFHQFIEQLKHSVGHLDIAFAAGESCYEAPADWLGEKIQIKDRTRDPFNEPIDKAGDLYRDYIEQLTKKCSTLAEKYAIIKKDILQRTYFGTIRISTKFFKEPARADFLKAAFTHEFGHFLDYLIKINAENWDLGRRYRSNVIHSDFNSLRVSGDPTEKRNYYLDETEFKHLASTYIEHLKKLWQKMDGVSREEFIKVLMSYFGIVEGWPRDVDAGKIRDCTLALAKHFYIEDIAGFFKATYDDSKTEAENPGARNRWTILKKWLRNELKKA